MSRALVVIDMQKDLCYNPKRKQKVLQMLEPLQRTIDLFYSLGYPIFYPYFSLPPDDEQFKRFGDKYCIEGTEGTEIITELLPIKGILIKKTKHSAFFETDLDQSLKEKNVNTVYLTGLQTQICIMTTAADANFRGYHAVAIRDCVLSTKEENKKYALDWIAKYVGDVATLEQIENELKHD